jgi:hypothetical protein
MKRLKMLDNVIEVVLDENIIFADEVMYQIIEENGEVVISEVENIDHKNITSESQKDDTIIHMHSDEDSIQSVAFMRENREHNEEMRDCSGISYLKCFTSVLSELFSHLLHIYPF